MRNGPEGWLLAEDTDLMKHAPDQQLQGWLEERGIEQMTPEWIDDHIRGGAIGLSQEWIDTYGEPKCLWGPNR